MLTYRTFYAQYVGETPEAVVQALYADAKAGTGMSLDEWWDYQAKLWSTKYKQDIPHQHAPDAARQLLDILVTFGALEVGKPT